MSTYATRLYAVAALAALVTLAATPAFAQYKPRPIDDPATGESYHIEVGGDLWFPTSNIDISSAGSGVLSGITGTDINAQRDLGFTDQKTPALQVVLRPARRHKLRFEFLPVSYTGSTVLKTNIVFNGIAYNIGVPVNSSMKWNTYQFGYEYDFISRNKGFVGLVLDAKLTDVHVELDSPFASEFAHAQGPIPAVGGIGRIYLVPNISITGEMVAFSVPTIQNQYRAHYFDVDVYGTINFTNNIGVKAGFRSLDVGYLIKADSGTFTLNGLYIGAVVRY